MIEAQDLYYQATVSKTKFVSELSDAEDVGIEDYSRAELQEIERFLDSDEHVLVMGGMSATNKTFVVKEVAKSKDLAFYDAQCGGREYYENIYLNAVAAADFIVARGNKYFGKILVDPRVLIIDEGMLFVGTDNNRRKSAVNVFKELLTRYSKLIICGGGAGYTSQEQSDSIAELVPGDSRTRIFPFKVKTLSNRQTKELVALFLAQDDVYKKVSDVIAEACLEYFRFARRIWMISGRGGGFYPDSFKNPRTYRESFMPDECFKMVSGIQEERARRAMEEIERVIKRQE